MDLDAQTLIQCVGDEATILPRRLSRTLSEALKLAACLPGGDPAPGVASVMLAETLLRLFVEVCGHYRAHLTTQQDGRPVLQVRRDPLRAHLTTQQDGQPVLQVRRDLRPGPPDHPAGRTARAAGKEGPPSGPPDHPAGRTARAAGKEGPPGPPDHPAGRTARAAGKEGPPSGPPDHPAGWTARAAGKEGPPAGPT